ncbi:MAG TPA: hypothetical protein VF950_27845 [Planctomycetota bacterium]
MTWLLLLLAAQAVEPLLERLRSDNIEERVEAEKAIEAVGPAALPRLRELSVSDDRELAARAKRLVEALEGALAREAFEKAEAALHAAKTLTLTGEIEWRRKDRSSERTIRGSARMLIKEGGKMRFSIKGTIETSFKGVSNPPTALDSWLVCDGRRANMDYLSMGGKIGGEFPSPVNGQAYFRTLLARGGIVAIMQGWNYAGDAVADRVAAVSEVGWKRGRKTYRLDLGGAGSLAVDLTLSEDGRRVLKRVMTHAADESETRLVETYDAWVFDAEIPDDTFALPAKK